MSVRSGSFNERGSFQLPHHLCKLLRPKFGIDRQRKKPIGQRLRNREVTQSISEVFIRLLEMNRNGIVNAGSNSGRLEFFCTSSRRSSSME